jgi:hypothetical protein
MTKKSVFLAGLVLMGAAAGALAQEKEPAVRSEDQDEQVQATAPRKRIRVLEDPHQISSFYRSRQSHATLFGFDDQAAPLGRVSENPYAIAGYYRSRQGGSAYGYSQFWVSGYGNSRGRRLGYGRRIGANGDLFLITPTIMAPVGPLTGAFSLDR